MSRYIDNELFELMYLKMNGQLDENNEMACIVNNVPNLFTEGSECQKLYDEICLLQNQILEFPEKVAINESFEIISNNWEKIIKIMMRSVIEMRMHSKSILVCV